MNRIALSLMLGLSAFSSPAFAHKGVQGSAQQNSINHQNNSGQVTQSPIGGVNHNTQINNSSISEFSFGPGINCPTAGIAVSSSYAGGSGGFDGYSASVSYVMPLGGSIGRACKELAQEITRQRQLDTQVTMIQQCATFAAQGIQIDVESFPEFSVCNAVQVNGTSAVTN